MFSPIFLQNLHTTYPLPHEYAPQPVGFSGYPVFPMISSPSQLLSHFPTLGVNDTQVMDQTRHSSQQDSGDTDYAASKVKFEERIKEELDICHIQQNTSPENYKRKYHNLVCWEEKAHIEILGEK